ncbi:lipopolysaccharide core heptosyltransferase RfaQ [Pluralibacter gergoviae]|uniref:lipopolysaccharide core heptosyltransferase RfaQ n=1 Tax=Pluralibacter gergoviae TaxID=61647 RepID=UPI00190D085C|nr:lipopolysaccharide core heptosyltransferase RfaQ [Pluralibacter gergoviae]EKZ9515791.1 lipopolysaccharide core heptosyltransferase RfaQ [Pluralibacter gergoviae]ELC3017841.1 lipopolysaccharide core heptosyltransferase RfaQ [Pluralibacter gergoviae]ELC3022967.1 lipopolysaccharide core heptosyltransferase RfaQ [Pluralibacter gergoviae]ELC3073106.1 lipopolysaccharide core heptosyltransferase RfaQ [Pluralibacter gergoviae]MBK4118464.1 lipopolysaccharide core heptosyltransferase RfaQ [Pluralibac
MDKPFRKILVIKMRFHGDMLLTTPVISTLKQNYPEARVDVLLYEDTMPILSENPEIHTLYGIKNKKASAGEKVSNFLHLIKVLRKNKYDLIVNLADQWMVAILVRLLNVPVKLSQSFRHRQSAFWKNSFTLLAPLEGGNVVESNLSVLAPLRPKTLVARTTMSYPAAAQARVRGLLDDAGVGQRYVVIQPTARQIFKCWNNEKFSEVIDALHERGLQVVLTSGPGADDLACVNAIAGGCRRAPVTVLAGKLTFPELGALIAGARLFIGVDSAPAHIAAAVDTPLVSLFGATDHRFWRPWSQKMIQFWAGDYRPMPAREQRDRNEMYLSAIPASDVIAAVDKLLAEYPGASA